MDRTYVGAVQIAEVEERQLALRLGDEVVRLSTRVGEGELGFWLGRVDHHPLQVGRGDVPATPGGDQRHRDEEERDLADASGAHSPHIVAGRCALPKLSTRSGPVTQMTLAPGIDSSPVKRYSPLVLVVVAVAAAVALLRSSSDPEPDRDWKPVSPS